MEDDVIERKLVKMKETRSLGSNPLACHMARVVLVYLFIFSWVGYESMTDTDSSLLLFGLFILL